MRSEAQKKADRKYEKNNVRRLTIKLNRNTDDDLIDYLEGIDNVQGFVKELIRQHIKSGN